MLTQSQSILVVHLFSRKKTHQPFNSIYWSPWDLLGISKHEIPIQNHIVFDTINNRGRAKNIENSFVITSNFTMLLIFMYSKNFTFSFQQYKNARIMIDHTLNVIYPLELPELVQKVHDFFYCNRYLSINVKSTRLIRRQNR